jgi:apolipoprotein N-acyltransferase
VLLPFGQFQTIVPLAAWLAPVFLLRFARTQRARLALPILALVHYLATVVSMRDGLIPGQTLALYALGGALGVMPYVADTALVRRVPAWARTLVFPAAAVALDWAFGLTSLGTLGSVAYSQFGFLSLTQLASVTGIWGIVFLIMWLAPVTNEVWERGIHWATVRSSVAPFTALLVVVLLLGGIRLAFFTPTIPTVRVAALAPNRALRESDQSGRVIDDLIARTRREAQAGARIVSWSEAAAFVLKEDGAALLRRAGSVAREENIYLQLGLVVELSTQHYPFAENRAVLINPSGQVVQDYFKAIHPLGDADVFAPGPGVVPTTETPYGRLATIICFDADFPALVRQAGRARADILLVPSNDWRPVDTIHARAATFRAVENGVALVRPTGNGISVAVDRLGRPLAMADYFATPALTMVADVPTRGVATMYPRIGDAVAYLCLALLVVLGLMRPLRRTALRSRRVLRPRRTADGVSAEAARSIADRPTPADGRRSTSGSHSRPHPPAGHLNS